MSEAAWATIGAIFGGSALKLIEHWLGRADRLKQTQSADAEQNWKNATAIRDELRKDMAAMREVVAKQDAKIALLETAKNELELKNEELERRIIILESEKIAILQEVAHWKAKAEWPKS